MCQTTATSAGRTGVGSGVGVGVGGPVGAAVGSEVGLALWVWGVGGGDADVKGTGETMGAGVATG